MIMTASIIFILEAWRPDCFNLFQCVLLPGTWHRCSVRLFIGYGTLRTREYLSTCLFLYVSQATASMLQPMTVIRPFFLTGSVSLLSLYFFFFLFSLSLSLLGSHLFLVGGVNAYGANGNAFFSLSRYFQILDTKFKVSHLSNFRSGSR